MEGNPWWWQERRVVKSMHCSSLVSGICLFKRVRFTPLGWNFPSCSTAAGDGGTWANRSSGSTIRSLLPAFTSNHVTINATKILHSCVRSQKKRSAEVVNLIFFQTWSKLRSSGCFGFVAVNAQSPFSLPLVLDPSNVPSLHPQRTGTHTACPPSQTEERHSWMSTCHTLSQMK